MKRLLSLALAASLMAALALPAAAAEDDTQARLTRVTQAVKTALDLDTDQYEEFSGDCYEELVPVWTLQWSGHKDGQNLTVEALEDGTVIQYQLNGAAAVPVSRGGDFPVFPAAEERENARRTAEDFLKKVLDPMESAELETPLGNEQLGGSGCRFSGRLLLNGLPSPLNYSVRVQDGRVTSFWRDARQTTFLGSVPGSEAAATQSQAAAALKGKLGLKLEYVWDEDGAVVLRYVPETDLHTFYADAADGSLLDLTELQKKMNGRGRYALTAGGMAEDSAEAPAAMENGAVKSLSAAELAGAEKLRGVRTAAQLDTALRAVSGFGLGGYALASSSYNLEKEDGEETVLCTLRYRREAEDETYSRTVTVDARTGEVRRVYSYAPWGQDPRLTADQAREKALAFLKSFAPDRAEALELYSSDDQTADGSPSYSFTFARKVNGYFFPANTYSVDIDAADGSVFRFYRTWDEDVTFPAPEGLISEAAALDAWMNTYDVALAYRLVPQKLDGTDPLQAKAVRQGMEYFYVLRLTYALEREETCLGVDAKSGRAVFQADRTQKDIRYSDLSGSAYQADIEKLALYGVGYDGGVFRPGKTLTQWDLLCLLASFRFWRMNPETASKEDRDSVYSDAYARGLLTPAERSDDAPVTRAGLAKLLLDDAGYGPAARLSGIYAVTYTDRDSIPAAGLGYAAMAQALGMAKGTYHGTRTASRGEAAFMLCRLLERAV